MAPIVLHHTTKRKNVGAIMRHGLIPRDTHEYNYPDVGEQPVGVFGTPPDKDRWPLENHRDKAFLRFWYVGPLDNDHVLGSRRALVALERVPANQIERVAPGGDNGI